MRTLAYGIILAALAGFGVALAGCGNAVDTGTGPGSSNPLVATWVSKGADVAPLLAGPPFNNVEITATFQDDGTYSVDGVDSSMKHTGYSGTWETMASSVDGIVEITLHQVAPQTATAEGMYQIDASATPPTMKYEVVQTEPTNGLTPPVPDKGFGSTLFNGKPIDTLVQKFTRE